MKNRIAMIVAVILMVSGLCVCLAAMAMMGFDLSGLGTRKMVTNTYTPEESFSDIQLDVITADITFAPSEDGQVKVICLEEEKMKHHVQVEGNTLVITQTDDRRWYDHIGTNFKSASVTVYLPEKEYGDLALTCDTADVTVPKNLSFQNADVSTATGHLDWKARTEKQLRLKCTTGSVTMTDVHCGALDIQTKTGKVTLTKTVALGDLTVKGTTGGVTMTDVRCGTLDIQTTTGRTTLTRTVAQGDLTVKVTTGDVKLDRVDAEELNIQTTTGAVVGTLSSEKVFQTKTATGEIITPSGQAVDPSGKQPGKCTVETGTGDIRLEVEP